MRYSISQLEVARKDTKEAALSLIEKKQAGGGKSFKGTFEKYLGIFHKEDIETGKLITQISDAYNLVFVDNDVNRKRASKFIEAFVSYVQYMEEHQFGLDNHHVNLNWAFDKDLILYGNSPILCSNDTRNIAFIVVEDSLGWQNELRFPLFQKYLAEKYFECNLDEVEVGVFDIRKKAFEFRVYNADDIQVAVSQTGTILSDVKVLYDKLAA